MESSSPENIIQVALKTRSKPERDLLWRKVGSRSSPSSHIRLK